MIKLFRQCRPWHLRVWNIKHKKIKNFDDLETFILEIGNWLKKRNYKGVDVAVSNPPAVLSTTLSFSCIGWINLYKIYGKLSYIKEAERCINKLILLAKNGLWHFPYYFGSFKSKIFACENFMTLKSLALFWLDISERRDILDQLIKTSTFLIKRIGYNSDGCFWYSAEKRTKVPNISSMASSLFAVLYKITNDYHHRELALLFAKYCLNNQLKNGGYNYFEGKKLVYVPYHALEVFELNCANKILNIPEINASIEKAIDFLDQHLSKYGYFSFPNSNIVETILFKTPLWCSKAYLLTGRAQKGMEHYINALTIFAVPKKPYYYYYLFSINLGKRQLVYIPFFDSVFMRYNASAFEIGTRFLRVLYGGKERNAGEISLYI